MEKPVATASASVGAFIAIATSMWVVFFANQDNNDGKQVSNSSSSVISSTSNPQSSVREVNTTDLPFIVPDGYSIEVLAKDIPNARAIAKDQFGGYWVSQPKEGSVTLIEMRDGNVGTVYRTIQQLKNPHGLAIDPENGLDLYVAEEHQIQKFRLYSDAVPEKIADLPRGGRHTTRTLGFGKDGRLYVSIGSTCDVCVERNELHGTIISMNKDGSDQKIVAKGLRNAVFFKWHPQTHELYATEMGRDQLGDNLPPEEVNIVKEGTHYGWPFCISDQLRDETFQPATEFDCSTTQAPLIKLPAHIAPLGLDFLSSNELLVAEHGSWNSSVKVGYKIVRINLNDKTSEDFLTGFLDEDGEVLGRPVDILVDGTDILISDDKLGQVYRLKKI